MPHREHSSLGKALFSWRDHLDIHPAAQLLPSMSEAELKELAENIQTHGLLQPITVLETDRSPSTQSGVVLLDGRNRLDALALLEHLHLDERKQVNLVSGICGPLMRRVVDCPDPYEFVISLNIHRRHLTTEQKRELITKILKARPASSDRQIATITKTDHKTVGKLRSKMEGRGEIPHIEARTDTKGRKQPVAKRPREIEQHTKRPGQIEQHAEPAGRAKKIAARDTALRKFDAHVLELYRKVDRRKPERFSRTAVAAAQLAQLGNFLVALAQLKSAENAAKPSEHVVAHLAI
jgi:ParB-like nuclease domain